MQITGNISFKCGAVSPGAGFLIRLEGADLDQVTDDTLEGALTEEWPEIVDYAEWGEVNKSTLWIAREDMLDNPDDAQGAAERIAAAVGATSGQALRVDRIERIFPGIMLAEPISARG